MTANNAAWPQLRLDEWRPTYETLHLWSQIVGKVRLAHGPWVNHSWHVTLHVTTRGLSTSLMPCGARAFDIEFDLLDDILCIRTSDGERRGFALQTMPVAEFYERLLATLRDLEIEVDVWPMPVEIPPPVEPFPHTTEDAAYDGDAARRFWRVLLHVHRVFTTFRARFLGKVSPVHFFWGAFDLAVTRFSGRAAPPHPGGAPNLANWVMAEAYSHEVSSAGFWPGAGLGHAAFYAYAYPEPAGFARYVVQPAAAYYHEQLREFILPYDAVRTSNDPDAALLAFLQSTYEAAADLAQWDRAALECADGFPRHLAMS